MGNASINQSNPTCAAFNADSCGVRLLGQPLKCDNSNLNVADVHSGVQIGNLSVTGNHLTVEADFNRTKAFDPTFYGGEIVSKHLDPSDVNYLLRPSFVAITTSNGFYQVTAPCDIQLNKTYHVAMVYDGNSLKFFRNGFLMGEVPASGSLITNNYNTTIGSAANAKDYIFPDDFLGYINEVRIWNVSRTQSQIQTYMNTSLPNPTTQTGLQAYYQFNSLKNLQGNTAWDGTIIGNASIGQANPTCAAFNADSCGAVLPAAPSVGFTVPDSVCINTAVNISNTSIGASTNYWNFCSTDSSGIVSPNKFSQSCSATTINILSSNSINPPPIIYTTPGSYTICLTIDEGLPTQNSFCKPIVVLPPSTALDFSFVQDVCDPKMVTFHNNSMPLSGYTFSYNFGDGSSATEPNLINSIKYYDNFNNYAVTLTNTTGCADTIRKIIPVFLKKDSLIITNDTTICKYSTVQINSINASSYCWSPVAGLSDPNISNPIASPKVTTTYYLNAKVNGANLVINGDFSQGNVGFTNNYKDSINGYHVGTFTVDTTSSIWHPFLSSCHDHTTGKGNMLLANGSPVQGAAVWQETINNILPNTNYVFSTWLQSLSINNPALIQFYVNGKPIGDPVSAILDTCIWQQPLVSWNSGNNTTATIAIVNQDTIGAGNDFALDDISFSATTIIKDSITISVNAPIQSKTVDTTICIGQTLQLIANAVNSYLWDPSAFLSSLIIQDPVANPTVSTVFRVNRFNSKGCFVTDTFNVNVLTTKASIDFSFEENICNPLNIQFKNESTNSIAYLWRFGDGTTSTSTNPQLNYLAYGTYKVTLENTDGCIDSISKYVTINIVSDSLITTKDTAICGNANVQLNAIPALEYCWYPTIGLSDPTIANPIATPLTPTTYYLNAKVVGSNLIINGDFSQGNKGFTSQYTYNSESGYNEGVYWVGTSPYPWHPDFSKCTDHTTGNGNFMFVNGASKPGKIVWKESVVIQPNTNYAFSTWGESISPGNPAKLQFTINGKTIGDTFIVPGPDTTCLWRQFYKVWNSGENTSAVITIINLNTDPGGNDFALDDISFAKVSIEKDSINIALKPTPTVSILNSDTSICIKDSFQLKAIGALKYQWSPSNSLSNQAISNPTAFSILNTKYIVSGTNEKGCIGKDSINVFVNPLPTITVTKDTGICLGNSIRLIVESNTVNTYTWFPQTNLSSTTDANPIASPTDTTKYFVFATDQDHNCSTKDSVNINVWQLPIIKTKTDTSICLQSIITLLTNTNADHVRWHPTNGLSDSTALNPKDTANVLGATTYQVTASTKQGCISSSKVIITGLALPLVKIKKDSLSICQNKSIQIFTTASPNVKYNWTPIIGLSQATIANPIANPDTTTTYKLSVIDDNKCSASDSVYIHVRPLFIFAIQPNPAEICKGDSILITASGGNQYHWKDNLVSHPDSAANFVHPIVPTTYLVSITDTLCMVSEPVSVTVNVNYPPAIKLTKSNNIDCFHTSSILKIIGGEKYSWAPSTSIISNDDTTITVAPIETQAYSVKAFSDKGCELDSSVRINVVKGDIGEGFPAANAFTPVPNSFNNCFGVKKWGHLDNLQLSIFNRAGQRIYYTTNVDGCWDGTVNGVMQDAGTYIYEIKATTLCGLVYRKGALVLIR